jgi:chromosomal replication initiation ATPase DnaA
LKTVDEIIAEVASTTSITAEEILGRSHLRPIVQARHEVWRRVRAELGWSYPMIGKRFGRAHGPVMAALKGRRASRRERGDEAA